MARALQSRNAREYTTLNNSDKPIRNPYVVLREEFDDWAVLFNPDTGQGFGINPTGVYVWKLIDGEHSAEELLKDLCNHAEEVPEGALDHIERFLAALGIEGLVVERAQQGHSRAYVPDSPAASNEGTPLVYKAPSLVNLSTGQSALGACYNHGSYGGSCYSGAGATVCCISGTCGSNNGNCCSGTCGTTSSCCSGACDGANCTAGGNPLTYPCSYGSTNPVMCACLSYGANATSCNNGVNVGPY